MSGRVAAVGGVMVVLLLAGPLVTVAQTTASLARVALLAFDSVPAYELALREGLGSRGYVEGKNVRIDVRYLTNTAGMASERLERAAAEVLALKPDVIVTTSAFATVFKRGGPPVPPVVFIAVSDPVGFGLAQSLARPGGNFTGLSYQGAELNVKRLELLTEALPRTRRIGVLGTRTHPHFERARKDVERAAETLKVQLDVVTVADGHPEDIDAAFQTLTQRGVGALLALQGPMLYLERRRVVELAMRTAYPECSNCRNLLSSVA